MCGRPIIAREQRFRGGDSLRTRTGGGDVQEQVLALIRESLRTKEDFFRKNVARVLDVVGCVVEALSSGNKLLIFGNGGSAADAQHLAAEFVNRYALDRAPLPAIALTTDTSVLTSIGNDIGFNHVFARQIEALGRKGDIAWAISTSGRSPNVVEGVRRAREIGLVTICFSGGNGGGLETLCDYVVHVDSSRTPRVQEVHIVVGHIICELVERILCGSGGSRDEKA